MSNSKVYWKQRNGKLIDVDEMDIQHLRNTLKMLIRKEQQLREESREESEQVFIREMTQERWDHEENLWK